MVTLSAGAWMMRCLVYGLLPLLLSASASAFITTPTVSGRGQDSLRRVRQRFQPLYAIQVKRVTDPTETQAITSFFVDNFWADPISKPRQRQQLETEVYKDLTKRYIQAGSQKVKTCLLVARDAGRIVGCVGIESRTLGNGVLSKPGVMLDLKDPGVVLRPVIANLAVDRTIRRKGIGKKLLKECESVVAGWGQEELYLVVDEKNTPARRLYEKEGFESAYKDPKGTKIVPTEWQLRELPVTNLCMRKAVKKPAAAAGGFSFFVNLFGAK